VWSGGGNLAPGPLGSVAGDDRHRGSSVPPPYRRLPAGAEAARVLGSQAVAAAPSTCPGMGRCAPSFGWQSVFRPAKASFTCPLAVLLDTLGMRGSLPIPAPGVDVAGNRRERKGEGDVRLSRLLYLDIPLCAPNGAKMSLADRCWPVVDPNAVDRHQIGPVTE
jgi:hypothetical protein